MVHLQESHPLRIYEELKEIETSLLRPVSPSKSHRIFHKLDTTSNCLQTMKEQAQKTCNIFQQSQQSHFQELEEKIVSLYGKIIDKKIDFQVNQIHDETHHLQETLESGSEKEVKKECRLLKKHVDKLLDEHRLPQDKLPIIFKAKEILHQAHGHKNDKIQNHFDFISENCKPPIATEPNFDLLPEEIEELFDIALCFYQNKSKEGKTRFILMNGSIKDAVQEHASYLKITLFDEKSTTIQALLATAFELSGSHPFHMSIEEIEQFCNEALQLENQPEQVKQNLFEKIIG
jgi:hypothetical protein